MLIIEEVWRKGASVMTLLLVEVDVRKVSQFPVEWIPEQIDAILKPHHLKWSYGNYYIVEDGYDAKKAVDGAKKALKGTVWLRNAVRIQVVRCVVYKKLEEINTEEMKEPTADKMELCRKKFEGRELSGRRLVYPNPLIIDEKNKLLDGYTTYLMMKERGITRAACILLNEKEAKVRYHSLKNS